MIGGRKHSQVRSGAALPSTPVVGRETADDRKPAARPTEEYAAVPTRAAGTTKSRPRQVATARSTAEGAAAVRAPGAPARLGAAPRPAAAVGLSVVGVLLMAGVAVAAPNDHTLDAAMPLLRLPALSGPLSTYLTCAAIAAQGAGLIGMLAAAGRGWAPSPRRLLAVGAGAVCLLAAATPVGSSDTASYAAYGRIAALGLDPYRAVPAQLGGDYAHLVSTTWVNTPSVYGPVATLLQRTAAEIGGSRVMLTIWVLMAANAAAYLLTGLILVRVAADPGRAALMWAANPLLLGLLVGGGHLDTYVAMLGVAAAALVMRVRRLPAEALVGALLGLACGVKISAGLLVVGLSWPLLRARCWSRLLTRVLTCLGALLALYLPIGVHAFTPLSAASRLVSTPSLWQLTQVIGHHLAGPAATAVLISLAWPLVMLGAARLLHRHGRDRTPREALEQPAAAHALAFGWNLAAPWCMPWYTALTWPLAALLPRARTDYLLAAVTLALALLHNTGGHGWSW